VRVSAGRECSAGGAPGHRQLDGIRSRIHEGLDDLGHGLDALQESGLVEEAVVDGDVEASAGLGIEEALEAKVFHGGGYRREGSREVKRGV
jgi:hypothetical protein